MIIVATTSLPAVDRPNADRWNAARSCQLFEASSTSNVTVSVHTLCNQFRGLEGQSIDHIVYTGGGGVKNWVKADYVISTRQKNWTINNASVGGILLISVLCCQCQVSVGVNKMKKGRNTHTFNPHKTEGGGKWSIEKQKDYFSRTKHRISLKLGCKFQGPCRVHGRKSLCTDHRGISSCFPRVPWSSFVYQNVTSTGC